MTINKLCCVLTHQSVYVDVMAFRAHLPTVGHWRLCIASAPYGFWDGEISHDFSFAARKGCSHWVPKMRNMWISDDFRISPGCLVQKYWKIGLDLSLENVYQGFTVDVSCVLRHKLHDTRVILQLLVLRKDLLLETSHLFFWPRICDMTTIDYSGWKKNCSTVCSMQVKTSFISCMLS